MCHLALKAHNVFENVHEYKTNYVCEDSVDMDFNFCILSMWRFGTDAGIYQAR